MEISVMISMLGTALFFTFFIFFITLLGSLPLGVVIALARMSKNRVASGVARVYISFMRGTPLVLQLMFFMFAPYYLFGITIDISWKYWACSIGFILNYAAYFAEIYRSGIQSIPKGQYEAAKVLGYTKGQTFMRIVLPQVIKRILPAMGNEIITLIKDTSLAFVLGIAEMFTVSKQIANSQATLIPYAIAAAIYWIICLFIEWLLGRGEKKLDYYHD